MIYFHIRSWSDSTLHLGIMNRDGGCWIFDSFDEDYNPTSVKRGHIFDLILDKIVGSIEFGTDSVDKYVNLFPDIKDDYEDSSTSAERELYIQLLIARLPSANYEMSLLLRIHRIKDGQLYVSETDYDTMSDYRELENIGYVYSKKKTSHTYDNSYYFYLTDKGRKLVENHLKEKEI